MSRFLEVMGNSPINKVLDFLLENEKDMFSVYDIAVNTDAGYSTLKILLPKMERNGLIKVTKQVGRIKLYSIYNENLKVIDKLKALRNQINEESNDNNL